MMTGVDIIPNGLDQLFPQTIIILKDYNKLLSQIGRFMVQVPLEISTLIKDLKRKVTRIWKSIRMIIWEQLDTYLISIGLRKSLIT